MFRRGVIFILVLLFGLALYLFSMPIPVSPVVPKESVPVFYPVPLDPHNQV